MSCLSTIMQTDCVLADGYLTKITPLSSDSKWQDYRVTMRLRTDIPPLQYQKIAYKHKRAHCFFVNLRTLQVHPRSSRPLYTSGTGLTVPHSATDLGPVAMVHDALTAGTKLGFQLEKHTSQDFDRCCTCLIIKPGKSGVKCTLQGSEVGGTCDYTVSSLFSDEGAKSFWELSLRYASDGTHHNLSQIDIHKRPWPVVQHERKGNLSEEARRADVFALQRVFGWGFYYK